MSTKKKRQSKERLASKGQRPGGNPAGRVFNSIEDFVAGMFPKFFESGGFPKRGSLVQVVTGNASATTRE